VFEPFFTTKEVSRGTGLGLSQVHGFVHQSGGQITIESRLGLGTTITLCLPRTRRRGGAATEEKASHAMQPASVLVVEDNPEVADVTARMLEQLGHASVVASSAEAALRMIRDEQPIDLVLSDIVMAGQMDGLALARKMRAECPDLPIVLATGYSQAAARAGGEFVLLGKPYEPQALGRAMAAALSRPAGMPEITASAAPLLDETKPGSRKRRRGLPRARSTPRPSS